MSLYLMKLSGRVNIALPIYISLLSREKQLWAMRTLTGDPVSISLHVHRNVLHEKVARRRKCELQSHAVQSTEWMYRKTLVFKWTLCGTFLPSTYNNVWRIALLKLLFVIGGVPTIIIIGVIVIVCFRMGSELF